MLSKGGATDVCANVAGVMSLRAHLETMMGGGRLTFLLNSLLIDKAREEPSPQFLHSPHALLGGNQGSSLQGSCQHLWPGSHFLLLLALCSSWWSAPSICILTDLGNVSWVHSCPSISPHSFLPSPCFSDWLEIDIQFLHHLLTHFLKLRTNSTIPQSIEKNIISIHVATTQLKNKTYHMATCVSEHS